MRRWLAARREAPGGRVAALVGAVLGDLEGPVAVIDERGRVDVGPGAWRIEWGVGAEDRWHVAHEEVAVRQQRIDDAPAYATWMRVPGGDVIHRAAIVNDGVGRAVLLELENASPAAVVVAVAVRGDAGGAISADADAVSVDGDEWLRVERPAGGLVVGGDDLWADVAARPDASPKRVDGAAGGAAALLVAVPHRQQVRFLARIEGAMPSRWSTPAEVAAGWRTVTDRALSIELPDTDLGEAWRRILPDLVVQAGSPEPRLAAEAAPHLDTAGLPREADRARATVVEAAVRGMLSGDDAVAALRSLASRDVSTGEASGLDELAGPLAEAAGSALDADTLSLVARALAPRSAEAAADAQRLASEVAVSRFAPVSPPAVAAARVLGLVLAEGDDGVVLLPEVEAAWRGGPVDVQGLVTTLGTLSFSVRWHGDRPALLWERTGGPDVAALRCGLDSGWSSGERRGEALLAAPES